MSDNTKPEDFSWYTTSELIAAALTARDSQLERADLLNLLSAVGNALDVAFSQSILQTAMLKGARKDLSKF